MGIRTAGNEHVLLWITVDDVDVKDTTTTGFRHRSVNDIGTPARRDRIAAGKRPNEVITKCGIDDIGPVVPKDFVAMIRGRSGIVQIVRVFGTEVTEDRVRVKGCLGPVQRSRSTCDDSVASPTSDHQVTTGTRTDLVVARSGINLVSTGECRDAVVSRTGENNVGAEVAINNIAMISLGGRDGIQ